MAKVTQQTKTVPFSPLLPQIPWHHLSWPCPALKPSSTFLYPTSPLCRVDASNSKTELGSPQTPSQPISAGGLELFWGSRTELKNPHFFQQRVVGHTTHKQMCKIKLQARDTQSSNKTKGAKPQLHCLTRWKCYKTKHMPPFAFIKWRNTSNSACSHYLHPSLVTTSSSFPFLILGRTPPGSNRVKRAFF